MSSSGGASNVGIKRGDEVRIDPSTEQKQDDTLTKMGDKTHHVRLTDGNNQQGEPGFTGFNTLKVANETQIFEEGFSSGLDTDEVWNLTETGTGSVTVGDSQGVFETLVSGDVAKIETKLPHQFLHGFSTLWRIRVNTPDAGDASAVREWGNYDDDNGYFWRLDGSGLNAVIRRKTIDTVIAVAGYTAGAHGYAIQYLNGNLVRFFFDGVQVHVANSGANNLVANPNLRSRILNTQTSTVGSRVVTIFGLAVIREGAPLRFNTSGELAVTSGAVSTPPGAIGVLRPTGNPLVDLSPNSTVDDFFTLTSGTTLTLQQLRARVESAGTGKSVRVQLWFDPLGEAPTGPNNIGANWELIDGPMGNNFNEDFAQTRVLSGDGTARMVLRLEQTGSASMSAIGIWRGFEV